MIEHMIFSQIAGIAFIISKFGLQTESQHLLKQMQDGVQRSGTNLNV